jgi:hypothetical protein
MQGESAMAQVFEYDICADQPRRKMYGIPA